MTLQNILDSLPYLTTEERGRLRYALVKLSPKVEERKRGKIIPPQGGSGTAPPQGKIAGRKEGSGF